jgi:hypothetical protein
MPEIYRGIEDGRNPNGCNVMHGMFWEDRQSHGISDIYFPARNPELLNLGECSTHGMM